MNNSAARRFQRDIAYHVAQIGYRITQQVLREKYPADWYAAYKRELAAATREKTDAEYVAQVEAEK